jgi:hypothetical protein
MLVTLTTVIYLISAIQTDWVWSSYPESGFKVLTPVALTHESSKITTDLTEIELHQYRGGAVSDTSSTLVIAIDHYMLPASDEPWTDEDLGLFFDQTIEPFLEKIKGQLVYKDVTRQAGRDMCVWKGTYDDGKGVVRGNLMLYHDAYYGLQVFGLVKHNPEFQMAKFLDSFKRIPM